MDESKTIDKSKWQRGEWDNEPDREIFKTEEGFDAAILRHSGHGALCGYVGVPVGHPAFGEEYDDIDVDEVHGGLTYSNKGIAEYGENPDAWYFGFDCAHSGDLCPSYDRGSGWNSYREIDYVRRHIARLSKQLAELAK